MSIKSISLNKFLKIMYSSPNKLRTELKKDLKQEERKASGSGGGGGDFYAPFWSDAKKHVANELDLISQTQERISNNPQHRKRLYPVLCNGFLTWWLEKRRWSNLSYEILPQSIKGRMNLENLDVTIKVENLLSLKIQDGSHRLIYPYFTETPVLTDEAARLGLYLMNKAITNYPLTDMRILDVLKSQSYSVLDHPLQGNESDIIQTRYAHIINQWESLKSEGQLSAAD